MTGQPWLEDLLQAERCVLIVVDKQRWYLDPDLSPFLDESDRVAAHRGVAELDGFIEVARAAGVPVVWTSMTEGDDDAPANVATRWLRWPDEPRLRRDDPAHQFVGLGPIDDELVVAKVYPSAFAGTGLAEIIDGLGRRTAVITGGYAGRCVLATAFSAQEHGLDVVVPRGLAEPHPLHAEEEQVVLTVVDGLVGYVATPDLVRTHWSAQ